MNREFKYRVWDFISSQFVVDSSLVITDNGKTVMWDFFYTDYRQERNVPNQAVIQLFTGIKDKTGKEIYEGDVIKISDCPRTVVWGEETSCWCYKGIAHEHPLYIQDGEFEIIGNMFETVKQ